MTFTSVCVVSDAKSTASVFWSDAGAFASSDASASSYRCSKEVGILAVVVTKLKFIQIQRQAFLADVMVGADDTAFEQRPEAFDVIGMHFTAHILMRLMVHRACLNA